MAAIFGRGGPDWFKGAADALACKDARPTEIPKLGHGRILASGAV